MNNSQSKFDLETPSKSACLVFSNTGYCPREDICNSTHTQTQEPNVLSISNAYIFDKTPKLNTRAKPINTAHFSEFFSDFLQELHKIGDVKLLKVLSNDSPHLEGNVLVEFTKASVTKQGFAKFNNRLYNGSKLKCKLICIRDWKTASCGKFSKHNCVQPTCPFFHYVRNPDNMFKFDFEQRGEPKAAFSTTTEKTSGDYTPGQYMSNPLCRKEETDTFAPKPVTGRSQASPRPRSGFRAQSFAPRYTNKPEQSDKTMYEQPQYIRKSKPAYIPRPYSPTPRYAETQYKPTASGYPTYSPYTKYNSYESSTETNNNNDGYGNTYNTAAYNNKPGYTYDSYNSYKPNDTFRGPYPRQGSYAPIKNYNIHNNSDYPNTNGGTNNTYPAYNSSHRETYTRRGGRGGFYPRR